MDIQLERYLPEIVVTAIGGLMLLVRTGDIDRMGKVEDRVTALENSVHAGEQRIMDKLDSHARESREANAELQRQVIAILREDHHQ